MIWASIGCRRDFSPRAIICACRSLRLIWAVFLLNLFTSLTKLKLQHATMHKGSRTSDSIRATSNREAQVTLTRLIGQAHESSNAAISARDACISLGMFLLRRQGPLCIRICESEYKAIHEIHEATRKQRRQTLHFSPPKAYDPGHAHRHFGNRLIDSLIRTGRH